MNISLNRKNFIAIPILAAFIGIIGSVSNLHAYPLQGRTDFHPGHYIALHAYEEIVDIDPVHLAAVEGVSKRYLWKHLEPEEGVYDFSAITSDLELARSAGKQLMVFLIDKSHGQIVLPPYMDNYKFLVSDPNKLYCPIRWNPYYAGRYIALGNAIVAEFDDDVNFEGLAMQESALPATDDEILEHGYTKWLYKYYLMKMIKDIKSQMVHSQFFWHHNFIPLDDGTLIDKIMKELIPYEVVAGGPDILPYANGYVNQNYPLYDKYRNDLPLFGSAQKDSYRHYDDLDEHVSMQEIYDFAVDDLHANYIVWTYYNHELPDEHNFDDAFAIIQENETFNTDDIAIPQVAFADDLDSLVALDSNGSDSISLPTHTLPDRYYSDGATSIIDAGGGDQKLHIEPQTHTSSRSRGWGIWLDSYYWRIGSYTLTFDVSDYVENSGKAYASVRRGDWQDGGTITANIRRQLSGQTAYPEFTSTGAAGSEKLGTNNVISGAGTYSISFSLDTPTDVLGLVFFSNKPPTASSEATATFKVDDIIVEKD